MIFFRLKLLLFTLISIQSCKIKYATKEFSISEIPIAPDYSKLDSWAAHPQKKDSAIDVFYNVDKNVLKADVFYVYPTLLSNVKDDSWNSDVYDNNQNKQVKNIAIQYQASAWANAGKIYSPLYRQVHYRSFYEPYVSNGGKEAGKIAYKDVRNAFIYYLKNLNNGRPIIIAGHSQGAYHCKMLLKEFFDGKDLQNQLVAAYLPGTRVADNDFKTIQPMKKPNEINGYLSWNTFRINKKPKKGKHPAYFSLNKEQFVTNPITWDIRRKASIKEHKGLFFYDKNIYPKSIRIEINNGVLWSSVPKGINANLILRLINNYHFGDINLFWKDISVNALNRVNSFLKFQKN